MGKAVLDGVEVSLLRFVSDVSKIFRPIAERAVGVRLCTADLCDAVGVSGEPMQPHKVRVKVALRNKRLNGSEQ